VLIFGCSATYWLKPLLEQRLAALGWDVPVLEGQGAAIALARLMVELRLNYSGLSFPSSVPARTRRRIRP
jgi:allantoin racemase